MAQTPLSKLAAAMQGGGCKECQQKNEVLTQVKEAIHEEHNISHNHLVEIAYVTKVLVGVVQRLLSKFEEANGTPKGTAYVLSQASPARGTIYTGNGLAYDGVIRSMILSGPGNVTLTLQSKLAIGGSTTLAIVSCNGNAVPLALHNRMALNDTLSISTDAAAGTGLLALSAWIEPIIESGPEFFQMRR